MLPKIKTSKLSRKIEPYLDVRVLGWVIFGAIILLVSWNGLKVLQTNYELEKKIAELAQRNTVAELENENLRLKNKYLESDQYLELTARRQFNKAKPDETLYLVPESVALSKTVPLEQEKIQTKTEPPPKSRYQQNIEDWRKFLLRR